MAEKKGFEPLIPLWGIHDFQSCALDQLRDFSVLLKCSCELVSSAIIIHPFGKVKEIFRRPPRSARFFAKNA